MSYLKPIDEVLKEYKTTEAGLSSNEARNRLIKFGPNKIENKKKHSALKNFFLQFVDFLAVMLLIASTLSFILGSLIDGFVILGIVILNATISFFQEYKAEKAIEALQRMVPQKTTIIRNNSEDIIDVSELVPGDIVVLEEGGKIPADIRLIAANNLYTNDFAGVEKRPNLSITDINNMVFMGMSVSTGNAIGVVVGAGMNTEFGKIASFTTETKKELSPLQLEIINIGKIVSRLVFILAVVLGIIGFFLGYGLLENIKFTIGVAAALVPEGLPATISVALAIAVQKMAKRKAIIKKLSAVETMGCINVIATDKTGTLTKNEMTVKDIYALGMDIHVKGVGYQTNGKFLAGDKELSAKELEKLDLFFKACVLCNNAHLKHHKDKKEIIGDQTEGSLLVLAEKAGIKKEPYAVKYKEISEIAFTSERKKMSTVNLIDGKAHVFSKGAPIEVLSICKKVLIDGKEQNLTENLREEIINKNNEYASNAMRVLGLAYKPIDIKDEYTEKEVESDLIFLGLAAIIDPPREEVKLAINLAKSAGIKVFMVTGDYSLTGQAIALRIGLGDNLKVITGTELNHLSDKELSEILKINESAIFSRVAPEHKMRITKILQKNGQIVAVTGDGVNDAPALKKANVGVAMGITGTDVSKEAAEVILTDDSFASIISAIKEGRIIYDNMKKFIRYVFSSNFAELITIILGIPLGISPLSAIQIFAIDLGSDIAPSLALAVDPEDPEIMSRQPRNQKQKIFNKVMIRDLVIVGFFAAFFAVLSFIFVMVNGGWQWGERMTSNDFLYRQGNAATVAGIALSQIIVTFYCRAPHLSIVKSFGQNKRLVYANLFSAFLLLNVIYNPLFNKMYSTGPLELIHWLVILSGISIFALMLEGYKIITRPKTPTPINDKEPELQPTAN